MGEENKATGDSKLTCTCNDSPDWTPLLVKIVFNACATCYHSEIINDVKHIKNV